MDVEYSTMFNLADLFRLSLRLRFSRFFEVSDVSSAPGLMSNSAGELKYAVVR